MLDGLKHIPDFLIGPALAGACWFGFNYAVLAERAMGDAVRKDVIPACVAALDRPDQPRDPLIDLLPQLLPEWPGVDLKGLAEGLQALQPSNRLSEARRLAICTCGAAQSAKAIKFDYAVHTASFRLIEPQAVGALRGETMNIVRSEVCGALPWLHGGR